jgi:phosphatidylserine decarboxylase
MPYFSKNILLQRLVPQHALSRLAGWINRCQQKQIKNYLIRFFIKRYRVNLEDVLDPDLNHYKNFHEFFIRALKPEKRPLDTTPRAILSPADSTITAFGAIENNCLIQAKKIHYSLNALLAASGELIDTFQEGSFATFYLAPRDYHRVHMPCDGQLRHMIYIPGKLFSVNNDTTRRLPNLFTKNERVIILFTTPSGPMAIILIGALLVSSISTVWSGTVNPSNTIKRWDYAANETFLTAGKQVAHFQFGSTVILLFTKNAIQWSKQLQPDTQINFGQLIATYS